ncbi:MAG: hypothetical protein AAF215_24300 [Cyanobacteria bacterium P01_A01_bin.123]
MPWSTLQLRKTSSDVQPYRHRVGRMLRLFWQFSQFYGEYQSRPISERRRFVQDYEKQRLPQQLK